MSFRTIIITLSLFFSLVLVSFSQDEGGNETGESILQREQFIYERRAGGPGKKIPRDAYEKALEQKKLIPEDRNSNRQTSTTSWVSVNPSGMFYIFTNNNYISGRTNSIAFDPENVNTMYIGAAQGGVWKTIDNGVHWFLLNDYFGSLASGDIAIEPGGSNILYYGTGELNYSGDSHYGDGIYKSFDAGSSWTRIVSSSVVGSYISNIVIDPNVPTANTLYCSSNLGVFKSVDGGTSWTNTLGINTTSLNMDRNNSNIIYAGTNTGKIYKTVNASGACTWTLLTNGLPASGAGRVQLAISPDNTDYVYASISSSGPGGFGSLLGLYRTINGGSSWTLQNNSTNYLHFQGWYDNAITVVPGDPNKIVVGGVDIYYSSDGGMTLSQKTIWSTMSSFNFSHADIHCLEYRGGVLYCCSDGGVYKSTNNGNTWSDLNATISTLQYQSADYDPTDPLKLYGGCQDNNKQTSIDGGNVWNQRTTGDGGYTVVDPVNTNFVYGQYVNGSLHRSMNYGVTFTEIAPSGSAGGLFYTPYEMAPGDHNTIVFGRSDLWKTNNVQAPVPTWGQIGSVSQMGGPVSAIGISPTNADVIYIGTATGRIRVTNNNGTSWEPPTTGLPYVSDLFVESDLVCYATFGGTTGVHVRKTINGGTTWTNITGNLPNIAANTIVVKTSPQKMIFVGTDLGVFQSIDDGANWGSFSSGFPNVQVYDLKYKDGPKLLLAATHGRGCFTFDLNACPGPDIWMRDYTDDLGIEPNGEDPRTWISEDMWVRNTNNGFTNQVNENPEFNASSPNYLYVKVRNRGCLNTAGSELLNVRWSKASTSQSWPDSWDGLHYFTNTGCTPLKGNTIPSPGSGTVNVYKNSVTSTTPSSGGFITIPVLSPGQEAIFEIPWYSPNPSNYACLYPPFDWEIGHFCLVARIETVPGPPFGMTFPEIPSLYDNIIKNNNIIGKNVHVEDLLPGSPPPIGFLMGNASSTAKIKKIKFNASAPNTIFNKATVKTKLSPGLYNIWAAGGKQGSNITELSDSSIKLLTSGAYISNLFLDSNKFYSASLQFIPLSVSLDSLPVQPEYAMDVIQYTGDSNNIEGGIKFSVHLPPVVSTLNLKMFIQGFYNPASNAMVSDTVKVYLRSSTSPYNLVDSAKTLVNSSGQGAFLFTKAYNGVNYYLQLKHRNSLETWSKTQQQFTASSLSYDFTTANTQAYGNNMINIDSSPVRYAVFNGDINSDGIVDLTDVIEIYNKSSSFTTGYEVTDLTGDNLTDLTDLLLAYNNSAGFVAVMRP